MRKVGITGGIGSGKTVICEIFSRLGVPVYSADDEARSIMDEDEAVKKQIAALFGDEIYADGKLDRAALAEVVFKKDHMLEKLNAIVHPAVVVHFDEWLEGKETAAYILKEAAILYESGVYKGLDCTVLVCADEELRIKRVMKRDGADRGGVESRMQNQWSDDKKLELADYVITNDDTSLVIPQVLEIHRKLSA